MRIAVINEVSASAKNSDVVGAIRASVKNAEILNIGMKNPEERPELTYIHTGYISAIMLNAGLCDFVVGGCGTGQGFLNCVMQFPGVSCGLVQEPTDAWLFSQINGGNCISLMLNKGYGWAADINLTYVFEKLFLDESGRGYPPARAQSQAASRVALKELSERTHRPFTEIIRQTPDTILQVLTKQESFMDVLRQNAGNEIVKIILERANA